MVKAADIRDQACPVRRLSRDTAAGFAARGVVWESDLAPTSGYATGADPSVLSRSGEVESAKKLSAPVFASCDYFFGRILAQRGCVWRLKVLGISFEL